MGWSFGWDNPESLIRELKDNERNWKGHTLIDTGRNGNEFYTLTRNDETGKVFITLFLLKRMDRQWGYKDITESMGPYYYGCPEKLLRRSTDDSENAVAWRRACRDHRASRAAGAKLAARLKAGDKFVWNGKEITYLYPYKNKVAGRAPCGNVYAYKPSEIQVVQ